MVPNCNLRLSDLTLSIVINPLISENMVKVSKTPKQKVSQNMDIDLTCTPGGVRCQFQDKTNSITLSVPEIAFWFVVNFNILDFKETEEGIIYKLSDSQYSSWNVVGHGS